MERFDLYLHNSFICGVIVFCVVCLFHVSQVIRGFFDENKDVTLYEAIDKQPNDRAWMFHFALNCLGYSTILLPLYIINIYVKKVKYFENTESKGCIASIIRLCLTKSNDKTNEATSSTNQNVTPSRSAVKEGALLLTCLTGLMLSYLIWGLLQEKIMTQNYENAANGIGHFTDSQFLVFVNRTLAFVMSGIYLLIKRQPRHRAPLYKYSYCSFSNVMSAWCQYEALKFVSFPTQVLAKSCKILPVMAMGKIVSKNKYEHYEYVTAGLISAGMIMFLSGSGDSTKASTVTTLAGVILLVGYMTFDSFTSNWQGALFKSHGMTPVQMMCGVNLFSCLFTLTSLMQQGGLMESIKFMTQYPDFVVDCIMLSVTSATGQLFVYFTISKFGPVVFTIIMTLRQAIAVLLSCIVYGHIISAIGVLGVLIVFLAVFLRVYCNQRLKAIRRRAETLTATYKPKINV